MVWTKPIRPETAGAEGEFKQQIGRPALQRQFASEAANRPFSELTAGTNQQLP